MRKPSQVLLLVAVLVVLAGAVTPISRIQNTGGPDRIATAQAAPIVATDSQSSATGAGKCEGVAGSGSSAIQPPADHCDHKACPPVDEDGCPRYSCDPTCCYRCPGSPIIKCR